MSAAISTVVAAATSVVVTVLSLFLADRQQRRREQRSQRQDLNAKYLNPLRLHLVENHFRLAGTLRRLALDDAAKAQLIRDFNLSDPAEVSEKDAAWFNGPGIALMSGVYLTACLFAQLKKVREDFPYLRLSAADDTELASLLLRVQRGFLKDEGVYYVTQPSIGELMWVRDQARLLTYQELCERLHDPACRIWFDRLILFHLETARAKQTDRARQLLTAIEQLSDFLDGCVGGGRSIRSRWQAEDEDFG